MRIRVLNTFEIDHARREHLERSVPEVEFIHAPLDMTQTKELESDAEVIVGRCLPSSPTATPKLRWLQMPSGGIEYVGAPPEGTRCWPNDVVITNGRGTYSYAVAERVLWAIIDHYQRGPLRRRFQSERVWPPREEEDQVLGRSLRGQTVLIVGYGSVGRRVAILVRALGMRVVAVKAAASSPRYAGFSVPGDLDVDGSVPVAWGDLSSIRKFAREADVVVSTLPATAATAGVISADVIDAMHSDSLLVSVGRGRCLDLDAIRAALTTGSIGAASIDGFPEEPLPSTDTLWSLANSTVTPHLAGGVAGMPSAYDWDVFAELVVTNLRRYVAGKDLLNVISLSRGY